MPNLDELAAAVAERLAPPPVVLERAPLTRAELEDLVAGQRQSLALAVEGQTWVDAIAAETHGRVDEARATLNRALAALDGELTAEALAVVEVATNDVEIRTRDAVQADAAARAHRSVTVDQATVRLRLYEALLASADGDEIPNGWDRLAEFESSSFQEARSEPWNPPPSKHGTHTASGRSRRNR
ncbi:MAG: hypothetical protein FJW95_16060 [Actinobacteria bacterium]|nr:hypothetical protein [Actinomycetota bacterium]